MVKKCLWLFVMFCLVAPVSAQERRKPVIIEGKSILPLRVLARPFSNIYHGKDLNSGTVKENVPAFQPYYVYARPTAEDIELQDGWYEVGSDNRGSVLGWMQAKDVFEWQQTMCLAYTHPEGRKPVLMFSGRTPLADLTKKAAEARVQEAGSLYGAIESGQIPEGFPIRSVEPKQAVDIATQFYLLPILAFEELEMDGREGRLLQLAAATGAGPDARESTDIATNKDYLAQANQNAAQVSAGILNEMKMDVVFVSDTTVSMRPYIDATLDVIRQVAKDLAADPATAQSIRFGVWGYRDPVDKMPDIGYTTHNYTPALLPADAFVDALSQVDVTTTDSDDYAEDVFSGINDAIAQTAWTPGAIRILVLLGDAPGHETGHKYNDSGHSTQTLRAIADDTSVYLYAMHVKAPRAKKYHEPAEIQFKALSANPGMQGNSAYYSVSSEDMAGFKQVAGDMTHALTAMLSAIKQGAPDKAIGAGALNAFQGGAGQALSEETQPSQGLSEEAQLSQAVPTTQAAPMTQEAPTGQATSAPDQTSPGSSPYGMPAASGTPAAPAPEASGLAATPAQTPAVPAMATDAPSAGALAHQMVKAAMVDWIGKQAGAKAPRDIVAWAIDKDLMTPDIQSMEVRLLINKRQLDSLNTILKDVMSAGRRGQLGGEDFFTALQATSAMASRDPNLIKNAKTMADTGLIPEFLSGLPYRSRLMSMNNDLWMSWSIDEQDEFLNELEAKVQAYQSIHDRPEGWVALNSGDDPDEHVYPVSLELLP